MLARPLLILAAVLALSVDCSARDFAVTVQPHVSRIVFGDPLYVEVTIVNTTDKVLSGPTPDPGLNTFVFEVRGEYDSAIPDSDAPRLHGGVGLDPPRGKIVEFLPGKPKKYYWHLFLPDLKSYDDPFWERIRKGGEIRISGTYYLGSRIASTNKVEPVLVLARDPDELRVLERWANA
ncbi:MAG: hypothetical protein WD872_05320 [Pirellulaceae bacterium]